MIIHCFQSFKFGCFSYTTKYRVWLCEACGNAADIFKSYDKHFHFIL